MSENNSIRCEFHEFIGLDISWVGMCPWTNSLGFGTEDGKFLAKTPLQIHEIEVADDAVNGVAFSGSMIAFSSRESLLIGRQLKRNCIEITSIVKQDHGAHGVVASRHSKFLYACGPLGILTVDVADNAKGESAYIKDRHVDPFNAYQIIKAGEEGDEEVFVTATRDRGLFVFRYGGGSEYSVASQHLFRGRDIISISPLHLRELPFGVVALASDGTVILIPDVLTMKSSGAMSYPEISGVPYTVCASGEHLFLLTNKSLLSVRGGIRALISPTTDKNKLQAFETPLEATEMFCEGNDSLFVLTDGTADEFKINDLVAVNSMTEMGSSPDEDRKDFPQSTASIAPKYAVPQIQSASVNMEFQVA